MARSYTSLLRHARTRGVEVFVAFTAAGSRRLFASGVLRCLALANSNDGEGIVYEGDITPEGNGPWLRIDLRAHRSSSASTIEARIDFEPPGGMRFRAWSTEGKDRTLIFDHVQSEAKK